MVAKGSGDKGKWLTYRKRWLKEVVTKGSSDLGKWWLREVVTYRSGDEGKWWLDTLCRNEQGEAVVVWVVAARPNSHAPWLKRYNEKTWSEMRRAQMRWVEMKCGVWSASVKSGVQGVKSAVRSVKKVFAWRCIAPGSRTGHVLGQQPCNRFAQSTHGPGWRTAHASSIDEKGLIVQP